LQNEILLQLVCNLIAILDGNKGVDCLAGQFIADTNHGGLGNRMVLNQRGFNLGSRETVTRNIDDIVNTASDPVVSLVITSGPVTRELQTVSTCASPRQWNEKDD
jgi:hypothetical protein